MNLEKFKSDQKYIFQINQEILKVSKNNHDDLKALQLLWPELARIRQGISTSCFIYGFAIQVISEKTV